MSILLLVFQYLPAIIQAVIAAESALGTGKGETKKELVMSAIQAVAKVGVGVDQKTVQALSSAVDIVVGILNTGGVFSKALPPGAVK